MYFKVRYFMDVFEFWVNGFFGSYSGFCVEYLIFDESDVRR